MSDQRCGAGGRQFGDLPPPFQVQANSVPPHEISNLLIRSNTTLGEGGDNFINKYCNITAPRRSLDRRPEHTRKSQEHLFCPENLSSDYHRTSLDKFGPLV